MKNKGQIYLPIIVLFLGLILGLLCMLIPNYGLILSIVVFSLTLILVFILVYLIIKRQNKELKQLKKDCLRFDKSFISPSSDSLNMDEYILNDLYCYLNSGDGIEYLFDDLRSQYDYEKYISIINGSSLFSDELKNILLNKDLRKYYENEDLVDEFSYKDIDSKLNNYLDEINNTYNDVLSKRKM